MEHIRQYNLCSSAHLSFWLRCVHNISLVWYMVGISLILWKPSRLCCFPFWTPGAHAALTSQPLNFYSHSFLETWSKQQIFGKPELSLPSKRKKTIEKCKLLHKFYLRSVWQCLGVLLAKVLTLFYAVPNNSRSAQCFHESTVMDMRSGIWSNSFMTREHSWVLNLSLS